MKKNFFAVALSIGLVGITGCSFSFNASTDTKAQPPVVNTVSSTPSETANKTSKTPIDYAQWALPKNVIDSNFREYKGPNDKPNYDCLGLYNGDTGPNGGDLLSTLISDSESRKLMDLKIYTPEYITSLEKKIANYTHANYQADYYAFKVCHLSDGIDVLAGYLWPQNLARHDDTLKFPNVWETTNKKALVVVVNHDQTYGYQNLRVLGNTVTGAEVPPCSATLQGDAIDWDCFNHVDFSNGIDEAKNYSDHWLLPLNGGTPKVQKNVLSGS